MHTAVRLLLGWRLPQGGLRVRREDVRHLRRSMLPAHPAQQPAGGLRQGPRHDLLRRRLLPQVGHLRRHHLLLRCRMLLGPGTVPLRQRPLLPRCGSELLLRRRCRLLRRRLPGRVLCVERPSAGPERPARDHGNLEHVDQFHHTPVDCARNLALRDPGTTGASVARTMGHAPHGRASVEAAQVGRNFRGEAVTGKPCSRGGGNPSAGEE